MFIELSSYTLQMCMCTCHCLGIKEMFNLQVREMEMYLTTTDTIIRSRGTSFFPPVYKFLGLFWGNHWIIGNISLISTQLDLAQKRIENRKTIWICTFHFSLLAIQLSLLSSKTGQKWSHNIVNWTYMVFSLGSLMELQLKGPFCSFNNLAIVWEPFLSTF